MVKKSTMPEVVYPGEVAKELGVSVALLHKWRRNEQGPPSFRLSETKTAPYLYPRKELDEWKAAQLQEKMAEIQKSYS